MRDQEKGGGAGLSYGMVCLAAELLTEECIKSPGEIKSRKVELGCHTGCFVLLLNCSSTAAFRTLPLCFCYRTAVETAVRGVHKLLRTGGVPTSLTLLLWLLLTVCSVLTGRSAGTSYSQVPEPPPPSPLPIPL